LSSSATMEVASSGEVDFAVSHDGSFVFPKFLPTFDGSATLVHLLGLLEKSQMSLSEVRSSVEAHRVVHKTVTTPWEQKGLVMRTMVEANQDKEVILIDGVKITVGGGWVLVIPDPDEPLTHVWAEGSDERESNFIADEFSRRIDDLVS
ncbi:MAG TPA: hypothetical protein VMU77_05690, partial [Acidimicrobiales bacterium]|nr:hypothetical protein [Acidimicrobiales bacterium]